MAADTTTYARRLREALNRDGWSQARLVRELAAKTGNAAESERSAVRGYLKGALPRPERARLIAEITGTPGLALVEHPRASASARVERRLEELAANDAEILANQKRAVGEILREVRALAATLERLLEGGRTAPKRRFQ